MFAVLAQSLPALPEAGIPTWSVYPAAVLLIAWGAILCVWGFRLFRVMLAIYGFLLGAILLGMVGLKYGGFHGATGGAIIGGLACAILSYFLMHIWVFLLGAAFGAGIMQAAGWTESWLLWLATFAVALLFGVLALRYVRALIIVLTSVSGAGQIVWGVMLVLGVYINQELLAANDAVPRVSALFAKYHLAVISWFALAVLSAAWQYAVSYRQEAAFRAKADERKHQMATLPRAGSPLPPRAMQDIYEGRLTVPALETHVPYIRIALAAVYLLLTIWGGYYEYRVQGLLDEAGTLRRQGDLAGARSAYAKVIEEYPLSFGFIDARREMTAVWRELAAEDGEPHVNGSADTTGLSIMRIQYWLPLFACAGAGAAATAVFLTRLKRRFAAILAGVVAGAASFGVVLQLQAYKIDLLAPIKPMSDAALAHPEWLYGASYVLMLTAALLTLTPVGRRKKT
jgi:hypothetical protein